MTLSDSILQGANAEFLLNLYYPELAEDWNVSCQGSFYRNYSEDIMEVDPQQKTLSLSRDSFTDLLPAGMLARYDELKGKDFKQKLEKAKRREAVIRDLFSPVDSMFFRQRMRAEAASSDIAREGTAILLKECLGYDLEAETDPYVRKVAPMLLMVSRFRADYGFLRSLLSSLMRCRVEMVTGKYSWDEGLAYEQPAVRYNLIIPGLDSQTYKQIDHELEALRDFIREWFMPFDVYCTIDIRYPGQEFEPGEKAVLDYNTEIRP